MKKFLKKEKKNNKKKRIKINEGYFLIGIYFYWFGFYKDFI